MLTIKRMLQEEQPRIDAVLNAEIDALPVQVRAIASHSLHAGGKRLRPLLAATVGRAFGCNDPAIYTIAAAIEFVHVASLIHDDVLDNATTRRGILSAHAVFTPTVAILAGDAMLAHAAGMVARISNSHISAVFAETVMRTAVGEIDEFTLQGNLDVDYPQYLAMITGKTAWMLRVACEIPAYFAGAQADIVQAAATFGLELGIAFQIVDDALDIAPSQKTGKPSGGDLRERKCTPLTRFYLDTLSEQEAADFREKFTAGSFTDAEIAAIIKEMRAKGLDEKTRTLAEPHLDVAQRELARIPATKERDMLALVPDFIRTRGN